MILGACVASPAFGNLVVNGGFESWTGGTADSWSSGGLVTSTTELTDPAFVNSGLSAAYFSWSGPDSGVDINTMYRSTEIELTSGEEYTFSAAARLVDANTWGNVYIFVGRVFEGSGDFYGSIGDVAIHHFEGGDMGFTGNAADPISYVTQSVNFVADDPALGESELRVRVFIYTAVPVGLLQMDLDSISLTQVPEPASLMLAATGGLLVIGRRRPKNKTN